MKRNKELLEMCSFWGYMSDMLEEKNMRVEDAVKKRILEKHPYKIWEGTNGYFYTYMPAKNGGRQQIRRKSREALEEKIADYWTEQEENPTIEDVYKEWIDLKLANRQIIPSTHHRYQTVFQRHYSEFGKRLIKEVDEEEFSDFLEHEIGRCSLSAKAYSNLKTVTRGFLKRAKKKKLIDYTMEDVLAMVDISNRKFNETVKEDEKEVFSDEEMVQICTYLEQNEDMINLGLFLLFYSGMRVGELVALKHEDFCDGFIKIRRRETRYPVENGFKREVLDFPKTRAGIREVVIPNDYLWIMERLNAYNPTEDYIFMRNGIRTGTQTFRNRLTRICKKLGIPPRSPHKIRKTYATILFERHCDSKLICLQMGHKSAECGERHYHWNRRTMEQKRDIISEIPEFKKRPDKIIA